MTTEIRVLRPEIVHQLCCAFSRWRGAEIALENPCESRGQCPPSPSLARFHGASMWHSGTVYITHIIFYKGHREIQTMPVP